MKKKIYQRPIMQELLISREVSLLSGSNPYLKEGETGNGGPIDTNNPVGSGLSREFDDFDDDFDF